jgi:cellulose biosynthesis protein BcsQ
MNVRTSTPGRVITFYSYKGGTGRSMALANAAFMLAANGQRVLAIDWDLEAPGLQRYFQPYLRDPALEASDGLIDFIIAFADAAARGSPSTSSDDRWFERLADLRMFAYGVNWDGFEKSGGHLDFVPAGRQDAGYSMRVNSFNWQHFYTKLGGGVFLEAVKQRLRDNYDYILIDSRTGVSDTSGVCTVQMPDSLVVCFTLNEQSIHGAAGTATSAIEQRRVTPGESTLRVIPVPTRVDSSEKERVDAARAVARSRFDRFLDWIDEDQFDQYWSDVETPHIPFYSLEEVLAVFDKPRVRTSLLPSVEGLVSWISEQRITEFPPLDERRRLQEQSRFLRRLRPLEPPPAEEVLLFVSCSRQNMDENLRQFLALLSEELSALTGVDRSHVMFLDESLIEAGSDLLSEVDNAIRNARAVLGIVSPHWVRSEFAARERERAASLGKPLLLLEWIPTSLPTSLSDIDVLRAAADGGYRYATRDRSQWKEIYEVARAISRIVSASSSSREGITVEEEVTAADGKREVLVTIVAERSKVMQRLSSKPENYGLRRMDWKPYPLGADQTVGALVRAAAAEAGIAVRLVSLHGFRKWLNDPRDHRVALVIVDVLTAAMPEYERQLLEWDRTASKPGSALVCVPKPEDLTEYAMRYQRMTTGRHTIRVVDRYTAFRSDLAQELRVLQREAGGPEAQQLELALRFAESAALPEPREGRRGGYERVRNELENGSAQAVVVGSQIVVFERGLPEMFRQDFVNGTLFAQLVANRKVPDRAQMSEWYQVYFDALTNIGWSVRNRDFWLYEENGQLFDAGRAIVSVLSASIGPQAASMRMVIDVLEDLQSMDEDHPWIALFSKESMSGHGGSFQVGVVEAGPRGVPMVTLAAFGLQSRTGGSRRLFSRFPANDVTLQYCAGRLDIDPAVAGTVRQLLNEKLAAHTVDFVKVLLPP